MDARGSRGASTHSFILTASLNFIRKRGLSELSVRSVCEESGLNRGAIQWHYPIRDDFDRAVIRHWCDAMLAELHSAAASAKGLERAYLMAAHWLSLSDASVTSLFAGCASAPGTPRREEIARMIQRWTARLVQELAKAKAAGQLREDVSPRELALRLQCLVWSGPWLEVAEDPAFAHAWRLREVRGELVRAAVDPSLLPPLAPDADVPPPPEDDGVPVTDVTLEEHYDAMNRNVPLWRRVYEPTKPLFHAFLRHERMDDFRGFNNPPEITAEDIAAAQREQQREAQFGPRVSVLI